MYYISTAISKFNHCSSVTNTKGEVLVEPFFFPNNQKDFKTFLSNTKQLINSRHVTGLEATSHYAVILLRFY